MKPILTAKEMQDAEANAFAHGLSPLEAMARAGRAVFEAARHFHRVLVYARCSNNGGDGFVCADLLTQAGIKTDVLVLGNPEKLSSHAAFYYEKIKPLIVTAPAANYDCVIDALFGIGFHGELSGAELEAAEAINKIGQNATVISIDIPSGLSCDNGLTNLCVKADSTVTFGCKKLGHFLGKGADACGKLTVADIGISPCHFRVLEPELTDIRALLPPVKNTAHKGSNGHAGVIAGSPGMEGAGELAAISALRCGAGKVSMLVPEDCAAYYNGRHPEIMVKQLTDADALSAFIKDKDVILLGPGIGRKEETAVLLKRVLEYCTVPLVLDADGLYFCTAEMLKKTLCPIVITPHLGEAARLFHMDMQVLQQDPIGHAAEFALQTGVSVLLKSNYNVVCSGEKRFISQWGTPAMATAGSGDVLAGITAGTSLLCGGNLLNAALLASFLHGTAGKSAQSKKGIYSVTASDISENIFEAFRALELCPQETK